MPVSPVQVRVCPLGKRRWGGRFQRWGVGCSNRLLTCRIPSLRLDGCVSSCAGRRNFCKGGPLRLSKAAARSASRPVVRDRTRKIRKRGCCTTARRTLASHHSDKFFKEQQNPFADLRLLSRARTSPRHVPDGVLSSRSSRQHAVWSGRWVVVREGIVACGFEGSALSLGLFSRRRWR